MRLDDLMNELFYARLQLSREELKQRISNALRQMNYSDRAINAVCVKVNPFDTEPEIEIEEIFYEEFAVRALRPQGFTHPVGGELILKSCSARAALLDINRAMTQNSSEEVAIWTNANDEVIAIDGAPAIAVFDDEIRFSNSGSGVEFDLAYEAMLNAPQNVTRAPIHTSDLSQAKEVMGIDHRGIVLLNSYDEHYYMDLTALRIAAEVAEREG